LSAGRRDTGERGRHVILSARLAFLFLVALLGAACAGGPTRLEPGTRVDLPAEGPEPGPLEAEARAHLEQMIAILTTPNEDPQDTVVTLGRYLDAHREAIGRLVRQLEARVTGMDTPERAYYEERFSDYFADANLRWSRALAAFRQAHPDAAVRVDGLMLYFD
jgi:hypothetical protein